VLRQKRVHIEWLASYLMPSELEVVARTSVFAGPFTGEAATAVGCCGRQSREQQQQQQQQHEQLSNTALNSDSYDQHHEADDVDQELRGLVQMSVLTEAGVSYSGGRRFSMHPLIRDLGRELRCGRLREWCGVGEKSVEAMMVQWMVGLGRGPGGRLVLHQPAGREPDMAVCEGVMAEEAANFQAAARLLSSEGNFVNFMQTPQCHPQLDKVLGYFYWSPYGR
jgi:hypothetical protein